LPPSKLFLEYSKKKEKRKKKKEKRKKKKEKRKKKNVILFKLANRPH